MGGLPEGQLWLLYFEMFFQIYILLNNSFFLLSYWVNEYNLFKCGTGGKDYEAW